MRAETASWPSACSKAIFVVKQKHQLMRDTAQLATAGYAQLVLLVSGKCTHTCTHTDNRFIQSGISQRLQRPTTAQAMLQQQHLPVRSASVTCKAQTADKWLR